MLLDGSPRTMEQARAYEHALGGMDIVIQLDVPDATIVERISNRSDLIMLPAQMGRHYNFCWKALIV
eukprot:SAG31_NODE_5_length_43735_cov_42.922266_37_plen_67_part_00